VKGDTTFRLSSYFKNVSLERSKLVPVENQEKIAMKSWLKVSCFCVQIFSTEIALATGEVLEGKPKGILV